MWKNPIKHWNATVFLPWLIILITSFQLTEANEICDWVINECPENLSGKVITVPPSVLSISSRIKSCSIELTREKSVEIPPSIVFVIDNSNSMSNTDGNDRAGSRFLVTRDLLDSISRKFPGAEVGVVVFKNVLYFDTRNMDLSKPLENVNAPETQFTTQAYMPLLTLNQQYTANGTTQTGLEYLKYILRTQTERQVTSLVYSPLFSGVENGTNINNAFIAAQQAFATAKNAKGRQFIIFLSDGEPYPTSGANLERSHGGKDPYWFEDGLNTPTTFTVYLHRTETTPPASMQRMTTNIQNNGYSTSNPMSKIWLLNTDYSSLMTLLMTNVIQPIMSSYTGSPVSMVFNQVISNKPADAIFQFNQNFPLKNDTTNFTMSVSYEVQDKNTGEKSDTVANINFNVVRTDKVTAPSLGTVSCYDRILELRYNGNPITSVNETMNELEVVFTADGGSYSNVSVEIKNADKANQDVFNTLLDKNNNTWSKTFQRIISSPVLTDQKLQHQSTDSIIIIYRNPEIPLDTIRKSYLFSISKSVSLNSAFYLDNNADGFIDSIFIGVNGSLIQDDLSELSKNMVLPLYRGLQILSMNIIDGGIGLTVKDGYSKLQTSVNGDDVIMVNAAMFSHGGLLQSGNIQIQDRMAPVITESQLTFKGSKDTLRVVFSEPVKNFTSAKPFQFKTSDGKMYSVTLAQGGSLESTVFRAEVESVEGNLVISKGDSIWINPAASITDNTGNIQSNPGNRRVFISVDERPNEILIKAANNPFKPDDVIPDFVRSAYIKDGRTAPERGMVIFVEPQDTMKYAVVFNGTISIYDVVKNPIVEKLPMVYDKNMQKLFFVWDGTNNKGRKVATGTYLAILDYTYNKNNNQVTERNTIRIGVKR